MTTLLEAQARVERMVRRKAPLSAIEDRIELYPFSDDMKAALWLYAYCTLSRQQVREETRGILYSLALQDALNQMD